MSSNENPKVDVAEPTVASGGRLSRFRNRRSFPILIIILVVIVGVTAWVVYKELTKEKIVNTTSPSYSYDEDLGYELLATHILQGDSQGAGLSLRVPLNGIVYSDSPLDQTDPRLIPKSRKDPIVDKGNAVEFGNRIVTIHREVAFQSLIAAKIVPPAEQAAFNPNNYFRDLMIKLSFSTGDDTSQVGMGMSSESKEFTNSTVKSGGKIYEVSAGSLSGEGSGLVSHMLGQIIEVKGKNANYYFLISANDDIWRSSPKTWQVIKDSIKVDQ